MTTDLVELADRIESRANEYFGRTGASDEWRMGFVKDAQAIRALASRAVVPDGFVLVPREPTWAMYEAWAARCEITGKGIVYKGNWGNWKYNYTEMLAAAPEPAAEGPALAPGCGDGVGNG